MGGYEDSQLNVNESTQNISGVPYVNVPFSHLGSYDNDHVNVQLGIQPPSWGSGVHMKQESRSINSGEPKLNMEEQYNIEQDILKMHASNGGLSHRYMNDRERLQLHNQISWEEATKQDVLAVRCRDSNAELYKSRLGSGSKGKCIKMGDVWLSPTEFENIAGRGSSKDWKRSIRFGGHTLQKLIEEGILAPHAISCTCSICCGDTTLQTGPVRLFTPYKRKRRDINSGSRSCSADRTRKSMSRSYNGGQNLSMLQNSQTMMPIGPAFTPENFDEIVSLALNIIQQVKVNWDSLKNQYDTVRDNALNQARVQSEIEKREALSQQRAEIITILKRILPVDQGKLVQQLLAQMHVENIASNKSCSNCGRDAYLECTACRRACYCSTFCQQKDWPHHQHNCGVGDSVSLDRSNKDDNPDCHRDVT